MTPVVMPPSTRDLLASVLGELPPPATPADLPPEQKLLETARPPGTPGPWRVTAKVSGNQVQISNNIESRLVPKDQLEMYLRGSRPTAPCHR